MLPGFRTLFAIVLLSVSVLVFGLGAAAFLRAAHDNLASTPAYRPIELAHAPRIEMPAETLSMMRVQTPADVGMSVLRNDHPVSLSIAPQEEPAQAEVTAPVIPAPVEAPAATVNMPEAKAPVSETPKADDLITAAVPAVTPAEPVRSEPVEGPPALTSPPPAAIAPETVTAPAMPEAKPAKVGQAAVQDSLTAADKVDAHVAGPVAALQAPTAAVKPPLADTTQVTPPQPVAASEPATPAPVDAAPKPDQVAALVEPEIPAKPPLPINQVRIPKPRVDPKVIEAQKNEQRARQQRTERAQAEARVRARRVAAARARAAAAQTRAADPFATSPFAQPTTATR